jgi:hypothetical protein
MLYLESIVGPRAEFHDARLVVKREICNVNRASAPKLGGRRPKYVAVITDHGLAVHVPASVIIRAVIRMKEMKSYCLHSHTHTHVKGVVILMMLWVEF